jgi:hypothetical protein
MHKTLTKVYKRPHNKTLKHDQHTNSKNSLRSVSSANSRVKIREENEKMKNKIAKTKSTYSEFRNTQQSSRGQTRRPSMVSKNELVNLLEIQLGVKPRVMLPFVRRKPHKAEHKNTMSDVRSFERKVSTGFKY